ncbi:T9SS type A sorting domain-containing protein [Splendidivirga corallicola]|uniref:T9SS type A sorting domain-containing protein n=1 Tax=Splendidivirga corallicola TaxID=3051826 RepID=UPI003211C205
MSGTHVIEPFNELKISLNVEGEWHSKEINTNNRSTAGSNMVEAMFYDLGTAPNIDTIRITWPEGGLNILSKIRANQILDISLPKLPSAPVNVTADVISSTEIELNWSESPTAEVGTYIIERSAWANKGFREIGEVGKESKRFSDKNLEANKTYFYRIKAVSEEGFALSKTIRKETLPDAGLVFDDVTQPLKMFPNPEKDYLNLSIKNNITGHVIIRFLDKFGKELKSMKFRKNIKNLHRKINIADLPIGVYMVELMQVEYQSLFRTSNGS